MRKAIIDGSSLTSNFNPAFLQDYGSTASATMAPIAAPRRPTLSAPIFRRFAVGVETVTSKRAKAVRTSISMIITALRDTDYQLSHFVTLYATQESDGFTVGNRHLNVYGYGSTAEEARADWEDSLIDLYLSYSETPESELAPSGKIMRDRLAAVIRPSGIYG